MTEPVYSEIQTYTEISWLEFHVRQLPLSCPGSHGSIRT